MLPSIAPELPSSLRMTYSRSGGRYRVRATDLATGATVLITGLDFHWARHRALGQLMSLLLVASPR